MTLPIYKIILLLCNFSIISYIIILIIDHFCANNKITSWSSIFNILSLTFLIIRGWFWLMTIISNTSWDVFTFYALYWIPNPIEFSSFMLLPLFFVQIIYASIWENYWDYVKPAYITLIIGLVCFQTIWALFVAYEESLAIECSKKSHHINKQRDCFHTDYSSNVFRFITAFCFLTLAILQAFYSYKIHYMENSQYARYMISSRRVIAIVNFVLFISFISRALYQFGTMLDIFHLPNIPLQGDEDVDYKIVLCFCLWDYLPTILLITTVTSRVIGDNRYYSNSILHLGRVINQYVSKTRSAENRRTRTNRGRKRGTSTFLPNQNSTYLQSIDEENPLIQLSNYTSAYGSINTNITENNNIDKDIDIIEKPSKPYLNIDKISSDSIKSLNNRNDKPIDTIIKKLSNNSISYPTATSNHMKFIYNNSHSFDSKTNKKISKDKLIIQSNSKESLVDSGYDYYDDDEIDRCSMDRFDPPSFSAINGITFIPDTIEESTITEETNQTNLLESNSFVGSPLKVSESAASLIQSLNYYKRKRGSSVGSDTSTLPSTSPRIHQSIINNILQSNSSSNLSKSISNTKIDMKTNTNIESNLMKYNQSYSPSKGSSITSTINSRIISSQTYHGSPNNNIIRNSQTNLREDDYTSTIARPMPIGGSKKINNNNIKSNLLRNFSTEKMEDMTLIRSGNPPPNTSKS